MAKGEIQVDIQVRYLEMHLQKLELKPGDFVVLSTDQHLDENTVSRLKETLAGIVNVSVNKVLVLSSGLKLGVLSPTDEASGG